MSIIDDIRIKQTFDPTGENGGYKCETLDQPNMLRSPEISVAFDPNTDFESFFDCLVIDEVFKSATRPIEHINWVEIFDRYKNEIGLDKVLDIGGISWYYDSTWRQS